MVQESWFSLVPSPRPSTIDDGTEAPIPDSFHSGFLNAGVDALWEQFDYIMTEVVGTKATTINTHMIAELDDRSETTQSVTMHVRGPSPKDGGEIKASFRVVIKWAPVLIMQADQGELSDYLNTDKVDEDGVLDLEAIMKDRGSDLDVFVQVE